MFQGKHSEPIIQTFLITNAPYGRMAGPKNAVILDEEPDNFSKELSSDKGNPQVLPVGEFCKLLRDHIGNVRRCLSVQAGQLRDKEEIDEVDQYIVHQPSIPLAKVLELGQLSTKMKIVLAYILAKSFWQFYNSDWMKTGWTSEFIHFMLEESLDDYGDTGGPKIIACNPCYYFRFDDSDSGFEQCRSPIVGHHYPRVLALGTLLVEIGGKASAPEGGAGLSQQQSLVLKINNDWSVGKRVLKTPQWPDFADEHAKDATQPYKTVVANCFDQNIFNTNKKQGIEDRRTIIYERIVYPLFVFLKDMKWLSNLEAIEPIDLTRPRKCPQSLITGIHFTQYVLQPIHTCIPLISTKVRKLFLETCSGVFLIFSTTKLQMRARKLTLPHQLVDSLTAKQCNSCRQLVQASSKRCFPAPATALQK